MLTERQLEVARLVAEGKSNKRIARELGVSVETVKAHVRDAAARMPGDGPPRYRVLVFALSLESDSAA